MLDSPDSQLARRNVNGGEQMASNPRDVIDLLDSPSGSDGDERAGAPCDMGPEARSAPPLQGRTTELVKRRRRPAKRPTDDKAAPVYELLDDAPVPPPAGKLRRRNEDDRAGVKLSRLKDPPGFEPAPPNGPAAASLSNVYTIDDGDEPIEVEAPAPALEDRVLDVFPDAARVHVLALLEQCGGCHEQVVAHLIDNPGYPRSKVTAPRPRPPVPAVLVWRDTSTRTRTWTRDFSSASSFDPTREYSSEAVGCLYAFFPFLTKVGSKALMNAHSHYAIAHDKVARVLRGAGTDVEQLDRFQNAMAARRLDPDVQQELQKLAPASSSVSLVMRTGSRRAVNGSPLPVANLILREELEYVEHKLQSWIRTASMKRERENKKANAQRLGTGVECACCFDEFDIDDMVSCKREGHLFCVDCLQQFASTKVFGEGNLGINKKTKEPSLDLICFHPDGCESPFDRDILVKALTNDTLRKYDEIQANLTISKAGLCDLVTCPRCGFQATLATAHKVFECPCDDCCFASCRECGGAAHVPLRYVVIGDAPQVSRCYLTHLYSTFVPWQPRAMDVAVARRLRRMPLKRKDELPLRKRSPRLRSGPVPNARSRLSNPTDATRSAAGVAHWCATFAASRFPVTSTFARCRSANTNPVTSAFCTVILRRTIKLQ